MKKRTIASLATVAVVAGSLVATSAANAAPRTVNVWVPFSGGNLDLWTASAKRIEAANPGLTVKLTGSVDMAKSLAAINAGNGPDISVANGAGNLGWFCGTGAWQKLNLLINGKNGISLKSTFTPPANAFTVASSGTRCALPFSSEIFGFYYNKDLFKAAGLTAAPKTTTELAAYTKKLTTFNADGSIKTAGFVPWAGYYGFGMDSMWLGYMFGASWYNNNSSNFNSRQWKNAFQWQHDLIANVYGKGNFKKGSDLLTKFVAGRGDEWGAGHDFITGRVAMKLDADWMAPMFCDPDGWSLNPCTKPAVNFGTAPFPVAPGIVSSNYGSGLVGGNTMGISKGVKNLADAWIVLKGLATDKKLALDWANANGDPSSLIAARNKSDLTYPAFYQTFYDISNHPLSGYHQLRNTGEHLEEEEIQNLLAAWQAGSLDDLSAGLAKAQSNVNNILARNA